MMWHVYFSTRVRTGNTGLLYCFRRVPRAARGYVLTD
jgi:hypothetical protein